VLKKKGTSSNEKIISLAFWLANRDWVLQNKGD
jgi:hypothetical protein